ncbi:DUF3953 domain-containing protein [Vibrio japonicus]
MIFTAVTFGISELRERDKSKGHVVFVAENERE